MFQRCFFFLTSQNKLEDLTLFFASIVVSLLKNSFLVHTALKCIYVMIKTFTLKQCSVLSPPKGLTRLAAAERLQSEFSEPRHTQIKL